MMAPQFPRPLQTSLDDTQGELRQRAVEFEETQESTLLKEGIIGHAAIKNQMSWTPVYDASLTGPDIGSLSPGDRTIWVEANSVFGWGKRIIRPVNSAELFAIWDYEGKFEAKYWSKDTMKSVMSARLKSPPAKMLCSFAFTAGESLIPLEISQGQEKKLPW